MGVIACSQAHADHLQNRVFARLFYMGSKRKDILQSENMAFFIAVDRVCDRRYVMRFDMKKILLFMMAVLCMGMSFTGCGTSHGGADTSSDSRTGQSADVISYTAEDFFDADRTHKPSENDIASIKVGMTYEEAVGIIGKPHGYGPTSGFFTLLWEADNGKEYFLVISFRQEENESLFEAVIKTGVVSGVCENFFKTTADSTGNN